MLNTIFRKQITLYLGILIVSFLLLGLLLRQGLSTYFTTQKERMLVEQGKKISVLYEHAYRVGYLGTISLTQIEREVRILNEYLDASFILTDKNLTVVMTSSDIGSDIPSSLSQVKEVLPATQGKIVTTSGKLGGVFSEPVLTVGYPVVMDENVIGVIFMNSSVPELQRTISEAVRIMFLCMLASGLLAFVLMYILSKTISRPLLAMNEAAKIIASGDFERRIEVKTKDEVGQLAHSFNNMAESLDRQERQRREFITNISHDLRSPLTSMRGFLQAIMDGTVPESKQGYYISIVLDETERLSKLANDVLDLNVSQSTALDLSSYDINELIRSTLMSFEKRAVDKALNISLRLAAETALVYADYEKIRRVVYNLIDNAVKFTDQGGRIDIETSIIGSKVRVTIKDDGRGISPEDQKRIFERFYKVDTSRGEDKKGSGLGLAIVSEFVRAHGERVSVKSVGRGCEFSFELRYVTERDD